MRQYEIKENPLFKPNYYDLANMFNVYKDKDGFNIFSINRTLFLNTKDKPSPRLYEIYTVKYGDSWTLISYNFYQTIELWWIICKFNQIKDPLQSPIEGEKIMIPTKEIVDTIVKMIRNPNS